MHWAENSCLVATMAQGGLTMRADAASTCEAFVGSSSSGIGKLILAKMVARLGRDVPFASVDGAPLECLAVAAGTAYSQEENLIRPDQPSQVEEGMPTLELCVGPRATRSCDACCSTDKWSCDSRRSVPLRQEPETTIRMLKPLLVIAGESAAPWIDRKKDTYRVEGKEVLKALVDKRGLCTGAHKDSAWCNNYRENILGFIQDEESEQHKADLAALATGGSF